MSPEFGISIIPGLMVYGTAKEESIRSLEILAMEGMVKRLERGVTSGRFTARFIPYESMPGKWAPLHS